MPAQLPAEEHADPTDMVDSLQLNGKGVREALLATSLSGRLWFD